MARIFVANLNYSIGESALRSAFEHYGRVGGIKISFDHYPGRSKIFAFVDMSDPVAALNAEEALNGSKLDGRCLYVRVIVK
jgi:RNA recognition motif-containing protein